MPKEVRGARINLKPILLIEASSRSLQAAIKGAVAGYNEVVFIAAENANDVASGPSGFNAKRVAVDILVEAARFLGHEIAVQGGASLSHPDAQLMRGLMGPVESGSDGGNSSSDSTPAAAPDDAG